MSDAMRAAILGIVEGLTEFLPISSTGHMILAQPLLGVDTEAGFWKAFLYFVQIGAILAVIIYFQGPLRKALLRPPAGPWSHHLVVKLGIAFLPAAVVGYLFHNVLERYLEWELPVAIALIAGAGVMEWIESGHRQGRTVHVDDITPRQALAVGLAQCVSIIPGTSRSMATIMGGLLVGLSPETAAVFSFYLAIPTLIAAGGYSLLKHRHEIHAGQGALLGLGFAVAMVVALLVVDGFMRFVRTQRLRVFAVYRVLLGTGVLILWLSHRS